MAKPGTLFKLLILIISIMALSGNSSGQSAATGHYADINGLHMYYELYGSGKPLVLIHGGGSTINSTFGRVLPELAKKYRVIAVELQAHGRTRDIDRPLSFEQDADDVAALLARLDIKSAAIFGFSNGATTALQMAIRHPKAVERLVLASGLYKRSGTDPRFWEGFKGATLDVMPQSLKDAYLTVNPDPKGLQAMFNRDVQRMADFKDMKDEDIRSVTVPALVLSADRDVMYPEHSVEIYRLLPQGRLVILPGTHGEYMGAAEAAPADMASIAVTLEIIGKFLDAPATGKN
jgi:pimeloyl-ACP methyl ester carboxylesterase